MLGLGAGAVFAALGLGLVLAYRGAGVINFAHGAMAMYVAYVFSELRDAGDYVLPVPGLPDRVDLGESVGFAPSMVLALLTAAALGLLVHVLVFRPLRLAPALAKVVASVGIMIALQAITVNRFGTDPRFVERILPNDPVRLLDIQFARDRLFAGVLVVVLAAGLWAIYRFTRFGLATRAAAENEKGASLLGYSPSFAAGANWVLATVLAGLVGIIVAPITGLNPITYTLFIVPALGAALIGRFSSFGLTALAGLAIGGAQSLLQGKLNDWTFLPRVGMRETLPFLVIIAVLFLLGKALPTRGALSEGRLPPAPRPRNLVVSTAVPFALVTVLLLVLSAGWRLAIITSIIGAVICLSLVVLTGYVGQISLAQMAFAGVAGFTLSRLADGRGIPFPISPLLAALVAAGLGVVVGIPALRVRGVTLAVITLAAGVAIEELYFKNPEYNGGFNGSRVPGVNLFGVDLSINSAGGLNRPVFGIFCLVVLTLLALAVANLRRSTTGRRMLAVRANERAAAAAGVNLASTKLLAFAMSSFIAGIGGALIGYQRESLSAESYGAFTSLAFLAAAYLGGITSVSGAMLGGTLVTGGWSFYLLDQWIGLGRWELFIGGLGLIITAIVHPDGIAGAMRHSAHRIGHRIAKRRSGSAPAPPLEPVARREPAAVGEALSRA